MIPPFLRAAAAAGEGGKHPISSAQRQRGANRTDGRTHRGDEDVAVYSSSRQKRKEENGRVAHKDKDKKREIVPGFPSSPPPAILSGGWEKRGETLGDGILCPSKKETRTISYSHHRQRRLSLPLFFWGVEEWRGSPSLSFLGVLWTWTMDLGLAFLVPPPSLPTAKKDGENKYYYRGCRERKPRRKTFRLGQNGWNIQIGKKRRTGRSLKNNFWKWSRASSVFSLELSFPYQIGRFF